MIIFYLVIIFLDFVIGILAPLSLLPNATLPAAVNNGISGISGMIGLVWFIMPLALAALFGSVVVIVAVENWIAVYKVIRWVYSKIPGIN